MGFFGLADERPKATKQSGGPLKGVSVDLLHRTECKSCPLNHAKVASPHMLPIGGDNLSSDGPIIYMLGTAPTKAADKKDKPIVGNERTLLKNMIPPDVWPSLRFNNVIRTAPGDEAVQAKTDILLTGTRTPTFVEIECCRPSIIRDIEETQPRAIFGFGGVPLKWAAKETHPYHWMGRRIPVRIGSHTCWFYPFIEPNDALKDRRFDGRESDIELAMQRHLQNALRTTFSDDDVEPEIHSEKRVREGVDIVMGDGGASDLRRIEKWLDKAATRPDAGLDYETNALRPYRDTAKLLTGAVSTEDGTLAFPFQHREAKWTSGEADRLDDMWRHYLLAQDHLKIAHQLAFEMEWSAVFFGRETIRQSDWGDSISQAYVIDSAQGLLSLESLTMQYFGFNIKALSPVDRKNLDLEPLANVLTYNGIDAKYHRLLYHAQDAVIQNTPISETLTDRSLADVYASQLRRVPTLVLTQMKGIPIDQDQVEDFRSTYQGEIDKHEAALDKDPSVIRFRKTYGTPFRPTAAQDIAKLVKMLGYQMEATAKGGDATTEAALKKFKEPVFALTVKHRKASKIMSTYVLPVSPGSEHLFDDNCIRPIISTYKVRTWRTSSEDPNVQNWPKRGPNFIVRRIIKKQGFKFVAFDYAGIQARNVAMESRDPTLIKAFIDSYDIHSDWVANLAERYPKWKYEGLENVPGNKPWKDARSGVKNQFVFPTFFGASPKSITPNLANSGRIAPPVQVVEEMQAEFWERFPKIKKWHERLQAFYKKNGYVTGLSGFRRAAPISYNEIINSPIQADESLIVLEAMSALSELDYKRFQPNMEIHDDLSFIWPAHEVDARADTVIREMIKPRFDWINVPLVVEMSIGDNWAEIKEIGSFENVGRNGDFREMHK